MSCLKELLRRSDPSSPALFTTWSPRLSPRRSPDDDVGRMKSLEELENFRLPPTALVTTTQEGEKKKEKDVSTSPCSEQGRKRCCSKNSGTLNDALYKCGMKCFGGKRSPSWKSSKGVGAGGSVLNTTLSSSSSSSESPSLHSANRILNSMIHCMESLKGIAKRQERKCAVQHLTKEIQSVRKHVRCEDDVKEEESECKRSSIVSRSMKPTILLLCKLRTQIRSELMRTKEAKGRNMWITLSKYAKESLTQERKRSCPAELRMVRDGQKLRECLIVSMFAFLNETSLSGISDDCYKGYLEEKKCDLYRSCDTLRATLRSHGYSIVDK